MRTFFFAFVMLMITTLSFNSCTNSEKKDGNQYEKLNIKSIKTKNGTLFLKTAYWGVSADKMAIVISNNDAQKVDIQHDMVFEGYVGTNLFFIKNDTLTIIINTVRQKNKRNDFKGKVRVDSSDSEEVNLYYSAFFKNKLLGDSLKISKF